MVAKTIMNQLTIIKLRSQKLSNGEDLMSMLVTTDKNYQKRMIDLDIRETKLKKVRPNN